MAFAQEIEKEARRAKKLYPRCLTAIDKIKDHFLERHRAAEFAGWYWDEIAGQFHDTVKGNCSKVTSYRSGKSGGYKRGPR